MTVTISGIALYVAIWLLLVVVVLVVFAAGRTVRKTSLVYSWYWSVIASMTWLTAWIETGIFASSERVSANDYLWYAVAIISLCPAIGVLGARRPGARAWTWFVQVPLLLVLGWPAIAAWLRGGMAGSLQLEDPALVAYMLVLLMGASNYVTTRWAGPTLLWSAGLAMIVLPMSTLMDADADTPQFCRTLAVVFYSASVLWAYFESRRSRDDAASDFAAFDRVWQNFRDLYGVVWAKRFQDRLNRIAESEQWAARLKENGFAWMESGLADEIRTTTQSRIDFHIRSLLRRFVDEKWIDERLDAAKNREMTVPQAND